MYAELREAWQELTKPGSQFEIVEVSVLGSKIRTYKNAPGSVRELWLGAAAHGERDYLVYGEERWTYTRAHEEAASIAAWLTAPRADANWPKP